MTTQNNIPQTPEENGNGFPFGGLLMVLGGLFLFIQQFVDIDIDGGIFLFLLGVVFLVWGATSRKSGLMVPGGILSGLGVGVFMVDNTQLLGSEAYEGAVILFSIALGFALIAPMTRLFTPKKAYWSLIVAGIVGLVGLGVLVMELPSTAAYKPAVETIFKSINYLWPLVLIYFGGRIIYDRYYKKEQMAE